MSGALGLACLLQSPLLFAQTSDKAAAEALFDEGKRLVAEKRFEGACPKFAESQRLDPGIGTLLYLADCNEKVGKTATAWATFREAAAAAKAAGQAEREKIARARAAALEPALSRLTINVPEASRASGFELRRNGTAINSPLWGTAIPVDPGTHTLEATAPGRVPWRKEVQLGGKGAKLEVAVPELAVDGSAATTSPASVVEPAGSAPGPVDPPAASGGTQPGLGAPPPQADAAPQSSGGAQRTIALVAGGAGVVGLAVGTIFALQAKSKWSDSEDRCPEASCSDREGVSLADDARAAGNIATVGFGIGLVGLATGAVLWLTAPAASTPASTAGLKVTPLVGRRAGSIVVGGHF